MSLRDRRNNLIKELEDNKRVYNEGGATALNVTFRERQMQREKNIQLIALPGIYESVHKGFFVKICDLRDLNQIITDKEADEDFVKKVRRLGVEVSQV